MVRSKEEHEQYLKEWEIFKNAHYNKVDYGTHIEYKRKDSSLFLFGFVPSRFLKPLENKFLKKV